MTEILATSTALTLGYAVAAILLTWGLLRALDRAAGLNPKETIRSITDDPKAAALYFGLRFLGACLLVGLAIS